MPNDFRLSTDFFQSRKTKRLHRRKGAEYVLAIQKIWALAARSYPDGVLLNLDSDDIADEIDWQGDPDELMGALVEVGFIELDESGTYSVHDWDEWQPWVSAAPARQRASRKAIHERWANKRACKGGTEFCDERCAKPAEEKKTKPKKNRDIYATYTKRIRNVKIRNTPIPSPSPSPSPSPLPPPEVLEPEVEVPTTAEQSVGGDGIDFSEETATAPEQPSEPHSEPTPAEEPDPVSETPQTPEETTTEATARAMVEALGVTIPAEPIEDDDQEQSHNGCSVVNGRPWDSRSLDELPDYTDLSGAQIERFLVATDFGIPVGKGGLHRLVALRPTAWELRESIVRALSQGVTRSPEGYLVSVITSMRQRGDTPAPRAAKQGATVTRLNRPRTIGETREANAALWRTTLTRHGYAVDEQWVREQSDNEPDETTIDQLRRGGGDWSAYREVCAADSAAGIEARAMLLRSMTA